MARHFLRSLLPCLLMLLITAASSSGQATINSFSITNYTGYVIGADSTDGVTTTNRHRIETTAQINFTVSGTYSVRWTLLSPAGASVATGTTVLGSGVLGIRNPTGVVIPAAAPALSPDTLYRMRMEVLDGTSAVIATQTLAGRTYIHFPADTAGTADLNIVPVITSVTMDHAYLLDTDPTLQSIPVTVNVTLHRYDEWPTSATPAFPTGTTVNPTAGVQLRRASDNAVAPATTAPVAGFAGIDSFDSSGVIPAPATASVTLALTIDPTGHLDPRDFYTVALIAVEQTPGGALVQGMTRNSPVKPIFHFTGALDFGAIHTTFTSFSTVPGFPTAAPPDIPGVEAYRDMAPAGGTVNGVSGYSYGGTILTVKLNAAGVASVLTGSSITLSPGSVADRDDEVAGIEFRRTGVTTLDATGAHGTITAQLPAGAGWSENTWEGILASGVDFGATDYTQTLQPLAASLAIAPAAGTFYLCEETKPVYVEVTSFTWDIPNGEFHTATIQNAESIRKPLADALFSYGASYPRLSMIGKRSNDSFYNRASRFANASLVKGAGGGAEMSGSLELSGGVFPGLLLTHFPWNGAIAWTAGISVITFDHDLIDPALSVLANATNVGLRYPKNCPDAAESCGLAPEEELITLTPDASHLNFTADGGIQCAGTVSMNPLAWGLINPSGDTVQTIDTAFTAGNFLMAGTFLRGDQNALDDNNGPGVLLLTGFDPANLTAPERPTDAAYQDGPADYAGMNFRTGSGTYLGTSILQGSDVLSPYTLTNRSKYYARGSGVSGIHEAVPGSFTGTITIAGYAFSLSNYGLSYLSNEMDESRINGQLLLPAPANLTFDFENLAITCLGQLGNFKIDGAGDPDAFEFDFWDAAFTLHEASFVPIGECSFDTRLVIGFTAHASHMGDITGSLGMNFDGNFTTPSEGLGDAIPTRIPLPGSMTISGPDGQSEYAFNPSQGAYFNAVSAGTPEGFWSLFGTADVAFFRDIQTHVHTRCHADALDDADSVHLMGGWPSQGWLEGGDDPFTALVFDQTNTGFTSTSLGAYRDQSNEAYNCRAQQEWLGLINFDYPLSWRNGTRDFTGLEVPELDLLVLTVGHQLEYLSATEASLSFGIQYDGLPVLNLSNFVLDEIEGATGNAADWIAGGGDQLFGVLENGVDEFAALLNDRVNTLLDDKIDALLDPWVCDMVADVQAHYAGGGRSATVGTAITAYFSTSTPEALQAKLTQISDGVGDVTGLLEDLSTRLDQVRQAIDIITATEINPAEFTETVTNVSTGLLAQTESGGDLKVEMMIKLGMAAIEVLSDVLATTGAESNIEEALQAALNEAEPTLETIRSTLLDVRELIVQVQAQLDGVNDLGQELQDILTDATRFSATFYTTLEAEATLTFTLPEADIASAAAFEAEWKQAILTKVKDAYYGTDIIADVQEAVKERIYDLQGAFNEAVDSAFAALNSAIRDALTPVLAEIDNGVNKLLQGVGDKIGAGELDGFAHITGDSLDCLRIDGNFEIALQDPDNPLSIGAHLQIKELDSDGPEGCVGPSGKTAEMTLGVDDISIAWMGSDLRADLGVKFALDTAGAVPVPIGLGGSFEMTSGEFSFETFTVTDLAATAMFGAVENYFGAKIGMKFNAFAMEGGIFFGHSCTLDPLETIDPLVVEVIPGTTFTGIYCYGAATFPVYGTGTCFFNISAKAGAGVFYNADGPTYGGRLSLGIYGEALCAVNVGGEVELAGSKTGSSYAFAGTGRVFGEVGKCPFCLGFDKTVHFSYINNKWDVDF